MARVLTEIIWSESEGKRRGEQRISFVCVLYWRLTPSKVMRTNTRRLTKRPIPPNPELLRFLDEAVTLSLRQLKKRQLQPSQRVGGISQRQSQASLSPSRSGPPSWHLRLGLKWFAMCEPTSTCFAVAVRYATWLLVRRVQPTHRGSHAWRSLLKVQPMAGRISRNCWPSLVAWCAGTAFYQLYVLSAIYK